MPATESTWRNMTTMHRIFAVSGVILTLATIWMFYKDHAREWKPYQRQGGKNDEFTTRLREAAFETQQAETEVARLNAAVEAARELPIEKELIAAFATQLETEGKKFPAQDAAYEDLKAKQKKADEERAKAKEAQAKAAAKPDDKDLKAAATAQETAAKAAERAVARKWGELREEVVDDMQWYVDKAKIRETQKLGERKFKSADLDKAKADFDIGIRDNVGDKRLGELQSIVNDKKKVVDELTKEYQELSAHRKQLENILTTIDAPVAAATKSLADSQVALKRLQTTIREKRESYVVWYGYIPLPGKDILNLPILDAFMGRRKPDNLWSDGLMQDYANFAKVRRFDRCTTCHTAMQKSQPGDPTSPLYAPEHSFDVVITPRTTDQLKALRQSLQTPETDAAGEPIPYTLNEYLGLELADHGLLKLDDVIVKYVQPKSPVAEALPVNSVSPKQFPTAEEIETLAASGLTPPAPTDIPKKPGLLVGDIIDAIDGSDLFGQFAGPKRAAASLLDLSAAGKPFKIRIKRGLPHPYSSHPRLDLYLSDTSPHKLSTFACTICHEGQGSATDFKWASHTPNDPTVAREWSKEYGWFNNHHWIYPMLPERFTQATCLKCHHDVVELEPSEKFPDPPAAQLMHGYHLIRKYGCFGCHEVNGYDGPSKRVGPDLRLEPNFFAVAQQLQWEASQRSEQLAKVNADGDEAKQQLATARGKLAQMLDLAKELAGNPDNDSVRRRLMVMIEEDQAAGSATTQPAPTANVVTALAPQSHRLGVMLKDVDAPGTLRKPGPSLRFVAEKVDDAFLYDWIWNPKHFRPTTRMPKFFKLWDHLEKAEPESLKHAQELEPIEVRGLVTYLRDRSQHFEPVNRPEGIDDWTDAQMIARGKQQFETRGCLACHTHNDFPDTAKFRTKEDIVQGPDLSNIGAKFSRAVNQKGPEWLYSWIKEPTRYHPRTVMPNLFLEPLQEVEIVKDAEGNPVKDDKDMDKTVTKVFDPAEDITTYLLSDAHGKWTPVRSQQELAAPLDKDTEGKALEKLTLEYLNEAFFEEAAKGYYITGLPESMRNELKGAETELITQDGKLSDAQRLRYIGLKTVSKYGCYGCHDIPGFEDAKPIGTQLQNWGRKDPSRLAFEHINHYIEHGHGAPGKHRKNGHAKDETAKKNGAKDPGLDRSGGGSPPDAHVADGEVEVHEDLPAGFEAYYEDQLHGGSRIGFAYQKLKKPRSYDFEKTTNKRYNERLRMPQFPFSAADREAVITFVVGLVAEPPREKYLYRANPRAKAIAEGKIVLEKYNCGGCHILEADKFKVSVAPGEFGEQGLAGPIYPFLQSHFSQAELLKAGTPDAANRLHSTLAALPALTTKRGLPELLSEAEEDLAAGERYDPKSIKRSVELLSPTILGGHTYHPGQAKVVLSGSSITNAYTANGGLLTRYLLPRVTKLEQQVNTKADGAQAYGWLPPPLFGEGSKVQNNWLFEFLLEPYPIRPAVFLRMPKFNISRDEATKLVNYFAAVDNANYPYEASPLRQDSHLASLQAAYEEQAMRPANRLDDAMKIVTSRSFCVQCHIVADFDPGGSVRAKAPNLADVHRRMRPEYLRKWIGNPKMILPYTSMPVNIPYEPALQQSSKVAPEMFVGNSEQQVQALVDLLMNFDQYAKRKTQIAPLVPPPAAATPEAGATPAPATGANN